MKTHLYAVVDPMPALYTFVTTVQTSGSVVMRGIDHPLGGIAEGRTQDLFTEFHAWYFELQESKPCAKHILSSGDNPESYVMKINVK